mmetsp:Transcript_4225/g.15174  ORF Transcript_4225/g.15174 Transcript_4225/m.15174 type:complete len:231 (+) Transcript_4225:987-1679(+)
MVNLPWGPRPTKEEMGGWWLTCSHQIVVPSSMLPSHVSPNSGLKGFCQLPKLRLNPDIIQARTCFIRSTGSLASAAFERCTGASYQVSRIFSKKLLGSNIRTGILIVSRFFPLIRFDGMSSVSCLIKSCSKPRLFTSSLSWQCKPPESAASPCKQATSRILPHCSFSCSFSFLSLKKLFGFFTSWGSTATPLLLPAGSSTPSTPRGLKAFFSIAGYYPSLAWHPPKQEPH